MNNSDIDTDDDEAHETDADLDAQLARALQNIIDTNAIYMRERAIFAQRRHDEFLLNHFKRNSNINFPGKENDNCKYRRKSL